MLRSVAVSRLSLSGAIFAFALAVFGGPASAASTNDSPRERLLMDAGWKFHLGDNWGNGERLDKAGQSTGPASPKFNDVAWRTLNLPHDWVVELPFDQNADKSHGYKPVGPNYPNNSVGWYRRSFPLADADKDKRIWLEFDGAFRDARVFVNGYLVGHHESGYSSFRYDITDVVNCGTNNTVTVRADASEFEGWFYEGAGLYRHVWLVKTSPLAIAEDGTFVYIQFTNNLPQGPATIQIETQIRNFHNQSVDATVQCRILDPDGKEIAATDQTAPFESQSSKTILQSTTVTAPVLWSPETPRLYQLVTTLTAGGVVVDQTQTSFGIRTIAFDPDKGFLLNGQPYEIKGTCNHQDHAGVGAALPDALQTFRIARLKEMGDNAIRTSHNQPTAELLDACDRLGMLVMDENRLLGSDSRNLGRLERLVRRDRNHPSVFIWSLGNEEKEIQPTPTAARIAETMQDLVHHLDPTRQCTYAANIGDYFPGINSVIDVRGWNYRYRLPDGYHQAHPTQPEIGTEQASTLATRGIYANETNLGYMSAYDDNAPPWGATAESWWSAYAARPWLSGGFVWTGFDYRGEPTPYSWPCINSHFGLLDTCGFPKDDFYYYQAWWGNQPVVHLLPHWNWAGKEGQDIDVRCFANCEEVELFLNGQSLGRKPMPKNSHLQWMVKYAPGTLLARGYNGSRLIAEDKVETTGEPAAIKLSPDRAAIQADGEDLSIITVAVQDAQGRTVPVAGNLVHFELSGPGAILGVGNGDPSCHEPDVYFAAVPSRSLELNDWRYKTVDSVTNRDAARADFDDRQLIARDFMKPPERVETGAAFDDSQWDKTDVAAANGPLQTNETAVFRTRFEATSDILASTNILLNFAQVAGDGWVYLNGTLIGESHDADDPASFEIRPFLREGANTIAVVVQTTDHPGGVDKGVTASITGKPVPAPWQRSVFNGLAQVIVQSGKTPGKIQLTASSPGLASTTLEVSAQPATPRPAVR